MKKEIKTVKATYEMLQGGEVIKRQFSLPISAERYAQLSQGLQPESAAWYEVREALATLARLQGGDLGGWGLELIIQTEGD